MERNFYKHINKKWLKSKTLSSKNSSYSAFDETINKNERLLKEVFEEARNNRVFKKLFLMYKERDNTQIPLLLEEFKEIKALINHKELNTIIPKFYMYEKPIFINIRLLPNKNTIVLTPFYTEFHIGKDTKDCFYKYIQEIFDIAHISVSELEIKDLIKFYQKLTNLAKTRREKTKHLKHFKVINIESILNLALLKEEKTVITIRNLEYMHLLDNLLYSTSISTIRNMFLFHLLHSLGWLVSKDIQKRKYEFLVKILDNFDPNPYKVKINFIKHFANENLSELYYKKTYNKELVEDVTKICGKMIKQMVIGINKCSWISNLSKENLSRKTRKIRMNIFSPKKFKKLVIDTQKNLLEIKKDIIKKKYLTIVKDFRNQQVTKQWLLDIYDCNACYYVVNNSVYIPQGILSKPFYDKDYSIGQKLGGIGGIIGHELFHSLDKSGIYFDEFGLKRTILIKKDMDKYNQLVEKIKKHFGKYKIQNTRIDVENTISENIGDLGGLQLSINVLKSYNLPYVEYINELQKLFSQWAIVWRNKKTKNDLLFQIENDEHSPNELRVNAILTLIDEFYLAFEISKESPMYTPEEERIRLFV